MIGQWIVFDTEAAGERLHVNVGHIAALRDSPLRRCVIVYFNDTYEGIKSQTPPAELLGIVRRWISGGYGEELDLTGPSPVVRAPNGTVLP